MTFTVSIADRDIGFTCEAGESILDAAERAGYTMPYSCRKGVCQTCQCVLRSGVVTMSPSGTPRSAGEAILSCVASPATDIEIDPISIEQRRVFTRVRVTATVYRIEELSPQVSRLNLRLPIGQRVPFVAGQYASVEFGEGEARNYSMANASHRNDEVVLHVRRIPGGAFSDGMLGRLAPGDPLDLELPFGLFGWSDAFDRPAILLATGTGFAPLNSMVEDLVRNRVGRPVHFFWGGERTHDIYAPALLSRWSRSYPWFRFTPVLANPEGDWDGARGFVQDEVLRQYDDLSGHEVYACGNPLMIEAAKTLFVAKGGLDPAAFYADAFVALTPSAGEEANNAASLYTLPGNKVRV